MARGTKKGRSGKARQRRRPPSRRLRRRVLVWAAVAAIWASVALAAVVGWYAYDLPRVERFAELSRRPSVTLLAADGSQLGAFGDLYGDTITLSEIPAHLSQAVLAVEDRRFYRHVGVDPLGLARALVANLRAGRIVQGGSTITQQLAKNLFLDPARTIRRKVQEILLALWLEQKLSKQQILALYLNRVYLGAGTYGVDAAARRYFDKSAREVNLYEAALLAGLLRAPSRYNPARNPDVADSRAQVVLQAMVETGVIGEREAAEARLGKTRGRPGRGWHARYFGDWVLGQVSGFVGASDQDLVVATTLDPAAQRIAEEELRALLEAEGPRRAVSQGALVALAPDGAVRALIGGRDYGASQFNRAVQALRQPGSAFKAVVYLAGLEAGLSPGDRVIDGPVEVDGWSPSNYGERYYGDVTLREAFARSLNSVAVRLSEQVGRERVVATARRLGITSDLDPAPSIALGTSEVTLLELTGAYAVFANQGRGVWPYGIEEIRTRDGQVLYRRSGGGPGRIVRPRAVDQMTDLTSAVLAWGTGKAAQLNRPAAGKTGTSQDFRDAWFVGFTAELVTGVWLGNDDGSPMDRVSGGSLPAGLWRRFMTRALEGAPAEALPGGGILVAESQGAPAGEARGGFLERLIDRLTGGGGEPGARSEQDERRGR